MDYRIYFKLFAETIKGRKVIKEAKLCKADEAVVAEVSLLKSDYDSVADKTALQLKLQSLMHEQRADFVFKNIYEGKNLVKFNFGFPSRDNVVLSGTLEL